MGGQRPKMTHAHERFAQVRAKDMEKKNREILLFAINQGGLNLQSPDGSQIWINGVCPHRRAPVGGGHC